MYDDSFMFISCQATVICTIISSCLQNHPKIDFLIVCDAGYTAMKQWKDDHFIQWYQEGYSNVINIEY